MLSTREVTTLKNLERKKRKKTRVKKERKKKRVKSARSHIAPQHLRQLVPQLCVVVEQLILFQDLDVEVRRHAVILHQSHQDLVTRIPHNKAGREDAKSG